MAEEVGVTTPEGANTNRPYRRQHWESNRCTICGRFRAWGELTLHFIPDSSFSSEEQSWRECKECRAK